MGKRTTSILVSLLLAAGLGAQETATKRFSLGVGLGLKGNMADLGATITKDGSIDINDDTVANKYYSTGKVIMSDRDNQAIRYNSASTASPFNFLSKSTDGGPLTGLDLGVNAQYDLDDIVGLPLFTRLGFQWMQQIAGGAQERTLGDAMQKLQVPPQIASQFDGGTMKSEFTASWLEVPLSVGFNARVNDKTKLYAAVGLSYFNGGWDVTLDIDEKYANALGTHVDANNVPTYNLWQQAGGGSLKETIEFKASGLSIHYFTGLEQMLTQDLAAFIEVYASAYAETVESSTLSDKAQKLLTATSSRTLYQGPPPAYVGGDPNWFKRLAFPVVMGGASIKVGARYFLF